ncbi:MAG TPA: methylenetetrahydrofolate reductase [Ignavibacteriales bacterium]|nr:methylenetetrahydrofolate reductase [Ignavibacteriales bacterium]HOM65948.1 methylenetetrahydrofolate reductase [Ignavibacteriales bacterium]HPD67480.1 methylenetetrahydrofolate reductase [Ignavibacteriales bacterium]HRR19054.1 methylenetetrahydrofolate reductase [Ignavibacteriales bacterium]HRT99011.1 methylenetetrahydrofolate reductase [Ignavibacteriales bacterium]
MKVSDFIKSNDKLRISFEIIPPLRGGNISDLQRIIQDLALYNPPFIDVTSHSAEVIYEETLNGVQRKVKRKRPGTLGICALIQNKYNIDAVPHILCNGFTKEETEDFLIELRYLGIQNVLALRGDEPSFKKEVSSGRSINNYAIDLVKQIKDLNNGIYLEKDLLNAEKSDFCIGVAGYPEKHFEAPNLDIDIDFLKAKVDAGADYIVTQMFYDNDKFYNFVDLCRKKGINVPIIPGLKIITTKTQLTTIPKNFYIDIPNELVNKIYHAQPEDVMNIGVDWSLKQIEDLFKNGYNLIHFYVMLNTRPIKILMDKLKL